MRSAVYHVVLGLQSTADLGLLVPWYKAFPNSYFSESEISLAAESYPNRLWGPDNYKRLNGIKARVDPDHLLGCTHCIGDA
jgi:hypothetical protein